MHKTGHYGIGAIVYAPIFAIAAGLGLPGLAVLGLITVAATVNLPDIDMKIPFIKHRGPTHTVWFALGVGFFTAPVFSIVGGLLPTTSAAIGGLFGFFVGTLSIIAHLLGDVITPTGITPFSPLKTDRYTVNWTTADSTLYNSGFFFLGLVAVGVSMAAAVALSSYPV